MGRSPALAVLRFFPVDTLPRMQTHEISTGPAALAAAALLVLPAIATPGLDGPEAVGPYLNGAFPPAEPSVGEWAVAETYPSIDINLPMHIAPYPGTDRLICVAKEGRIHTFQDDPGATTTELFLDHASQTFTSSDSGMTWLVFHPEFGEAGSPNRGYVYITYKWEPPSGGNGAEAYWRLSRFTVPDGTMQADPASELVMIQQYDRQQWHDSGCMVFGPDGYLYVAIGDEGGSNDGFDVAQKLDDRLFSGILRIDVNNGAGSHAIRRQPTQAAKPAGWPDSFTAHYSIPDDNPFVDPAGGRLEEFFALGLRQPYRFSYDAESGRFWVGESGQDTEEELVILEAGANYGWPFREGVVAGPKAEPAVVHGTLTEPVWRVNHSDGPDGCVVGGFVYRGSEHPALVGRYLTVDNMSGRIRAFDFDGSTASGEILASMPSGSVYSGTSTIGWNHAGEPIFVKINNVGNPANFYQLTIAAPPVAEPLWFRFEDEDAANPSGYVSDNPDQTTGDVLSGGNALFAYVDGAGGVNVRFDQPNGLTPTGEVGNAAGIRVGFGDGDGYPGDRDGDLVLSETYGVLDDFTFELSFKPEPGSLAGGYRCYFGLDGGTGEVDDGGEYGPPIQPFRLMRWGRDDANATTIPLEDGDLFLNVRTLDPATGAWTSLPVKVLDHEAFVEGEWYHLAIVGDAAAGTLKVWRRSGGSYELLGEASGYVGNLQAGAWTIGRGFYNGSPADWVGDVRFDEVRMAPEALDPAEFLYAGQVWDPAVVATEPPGWLSETGAFSDLAALTPAAGVFPYTVNAPLWSDAAAKGRWIALPNDGVHDTPEEKIRFHPDGPWEFPAGTVLIKHFELGVDDTDPAAVRRLETRFIVMPETGEPYGLTYRWLPDGSDAELLPAEGLSESISIAEAGGGTREQVWDYPGRADCMVCHNSNADHVLGVQTHQLNGELFYPRTGRTGHQLESLAALGWFDEGYRPEHLPWFLKSHGLDDVAADPGLRVRSYLDSNCAQCHRPGGVRAFFDARFTTPLAQQALVGGALEANYNGPDDRVIAPGSLPESILHTRMGALDGLSMPPLAKHLVDPTGLAVLEQWILSLPDAPLVELAGPPAASGTFDVDVSFSQPVGGLEAEDFLIEGGHAAGLAANGADWILSVTPHGFGRVRVSLPEGIAQNSGGIGNFASAALEVDVVESQLATWLKLDEAAGTVAQDSSGGGNPGLLVDLEPEDRVPGMFGGALAFDGSGERVEIDNLSTTDFTVSFWMRTTQSFPVSDSAAGGARIFDADVGGLTNDWIIAGTRSGTGVDRITFHTGHADGSANTFAHGASAVNTGGWRHVAVTRDSLSGEMKVYLDGLLDASATGGTDALDANSGVAIGGTAAGTSFAGDLDQIRFYDRVLSPEEVGNLHQDAGDVPEYDDWVVARLPGLGHLHGTTLDPEGDGSSNFLEYVFGGDPLGADVLTPAVSRQPGGDMRLHYTRRREPTSLDYRLLVSETLGFWDDGEGGIVSESTADTGDPEYERVTLDYRHPEATSRLFLRMEASGE